MEYDFYKSQTPLGDPPNTVKAVSEGIKTPMSVLSDTILNIVSDTILNIVDLKGRITELEEQVDDLKEQVTSLKDREKRTTAALVKRIDDLEKYVSWL